jgi:hypothetical protein
MKIIVISVISRKGENKMYTAKKKKKKKTTFNGKLLQ